MTRISKAFEKTKSEGRAALITYICAGDPSLEATEIATRAMELAGADIIEIGIPFSDPIADGPTIAAASQRSLERGTSLLSVIEMIQRIRTSGCEVPIVLMGYVNPILQMGSSNFFSKIAAVGVDGVIIPDLPLDEAEPFQRDAKQNNVDLVLLAAPTTAPERLVQIAKSTTGFLYFVSITGVTGTTSAFPSDLGDKLTYARSQCPLPVAVGFGIANAEDARQMAGLADGVVVGSALVQRLATDGVEKMCALVSELAGALAP